MSDGSKRYKGQIQTIEGSPTGEPIVTTLLDYNSFGLAIYLGEAKFGTRPIDSRWYLNKFEYDGLGNVVALKTAINQVTSKADAVSIDTLSSPGFVKITAVNADLTLVSVNDQTFLKTSANDIGGAAIVQILSPTSFLIAASGGEVDESNTPVSFEDLTFVLQSEELKPFDRRRWDFRTFYIYE